MHSFNGSAMAFDPVHPSNRNTRTAGVRDMLRLPLVVALRQRQDDEHTEGTGEECHDDDSMCGQHRKRCEVKTRCSVERRRTPVPQTMRGTVLVSQPTTVSKPDRCGVVTGESIGSAFGSTVPCVAGENDSFDVPTFVKPETLVRWHRTGFRLFWRWKSQMCGWPPLPVDVQRLIATMARANATSRSRVVAAVEHLRAQPCRRHARVRRLRDHHRRLPSGVRIRGPGCRHASDRALERDRAPTAAWTVQQFRP